MIRARAQGSISTSLRANEYEQYGKSRVHKSNVRPHDPEWSCAMAEEDTTRPSKWPYNSVCRGFRRFSKSTGSAKGANANENEDVVDDRLEQRWLTLPHRMLHRNARAHGRRSTVKGCRKAHGPPLLFCDHKYRPALNIRPERVYMCIKWIAKCASTASDIA